MQKLEKVKMVNRDLPVELTAHQLADRGRELSELRRAIDEADESRKKENDRRKGIIADMEEQAAKLLATLGSGTELQPVECVVKMDFSRRLVITTRDDTGAEVSSRSMSAEEMEGRLEMIESQLPDPPEPEKVIDITAIVQSTKPVADGPAQDPHDDAMVSREFSALVERGIEVIRATQRASVTTIQRRMKVGYTVACAIMDEIEHRQIVGPARGAEPREILIDLRPLSALPPSQ